MSIPESKLAELEASLKSDGIDVNAPPPAPDAQQESTSAMDQLMAPVNAAIKNPGSTVVGAIRGVEKSFGDFAPNLTEKIEGTILFPVIRGAELAARMFSKEDHKPELTTLKQLVSDRILYTQALRDKVPGWVDGTQSGIAVVSGAQLAKAALPEAQRLSGVAFEKTAGLFRKSSQKLADLIIPDVDGPPLDAIINHPEKVLELVQNKKISLNDVATQIGDELHSIKIGLGENVNKHKSNYVTDPTKRITVSEPIEVTTPQGEKKMFQSPLQIIKDYRKSKTTENGKSILDGKQESNLKTLEEILTPRSSQVEKTTRDSFGANIKGMHEELAKDISPNDGMLALEKIDDIIDYERALKGKLESSFINSLFDVRRSVKYQMRGNNLEWFKADEDYADFMELQHGLTKKLQESDSAESMVANIFGENKERVRERLRSALNYRDFLDTKVKGSGDAFFRRMATIQGARKIRNVQKELTRVQQAKTHEIVRYWTARGAAAGTVIGGKIGGWTGAGIGGTVGGVAGYSIGVKMADPMRILNAAIREKKLSQGAKQLAYDLQYIHQNFGNDGVISMLDVIGNVPAVAELSKFSSGISPQRGKPEQKETGSKYFFPTDKQLEDLKWAKQQKEK